MGRWDNPAKVPQIQVMKLGFKDQSRPVRKYVGNGREITWKSFGVKKAKANVTRVLLGFTLQGDNVIVGEMSNT